jgi:type IV pilus assembly protein PilB
MLPLKIFKDILKKYDFKEALAGWPAQEMLAEKTGKSLEESLIEAGLLNETNFYAQAAEFLKIPLISLKGKDFDKDTLNLIPAPVAGAHQLVAFEKNDHEIKLAMTDPTDLQTIEFVRRITNLEPTIFITTPSDLKEALQHYHSELAEDLRVIQTNSAGNPDDLKKVADQVPIINIANSILEHAVYAGASDIHIEPNENEVQVRYRIDGILKPVMSLPKNVQNGLTARVKVLSNLKLDEHMLPQDGRFKIEVQGDHLAIRVSILPIYDGEKIVLRLLPEGSKPLSFEQLGLLSYQSDLLQNSLKKPHGMVLVTGPTGSGKTTTLYSILGVMNQPGVNISTVEDPMEYRLKGINQSQVNPKAGFTFATGLRALLRQDPNIIMVGEIRDTETAEIAMHAAMTGHLVLSSLHTNDAPTALPRLIDMGIPPFLVAYTTNLIIAQRLVRQICPHCKVEYTPDSAELKETSAIVNADLATLKNRLPSGFATTTWKENTFYRGAGCKRCGSTGYKGRVGIFEVMEMSEELGKKITAHETAGAIRDYAKKSGMLTMMEDGIIKAKLGITTLTEVMRVTKD